jgi:hypothetical protein
VFSNASFTLALSRDDVFKTKSYWVARHGVAVQSQFFTLR